MPQDSRTSRLLRRSLNFAGVAIVVSVIVAVATFNASSQNRELPKFTLPHALLFQLRDDHQHAILSAVVTKQGSTWMVIPRDTVMDLADKSSTISNIAQAVTLGGATQALETSTQLEIDAAWQIDRLGLAALVESIGGVDVVPSRELVLGDAETPNHMVLRAQQRVHLNGIYASLYAVGDMRTSRQQQLAQFREVWDALLRDVDAGTLASVLESVGSVSRASLPIPQVVAMFEKWQQVAAVDGVTWIGLKTRFTTTEQGRIRVISPAGYRQFLAAGVRERIAS
jgi:anionic cell wall polymer biosynthesis LytR-Cps2A-Psr (LCP) family protein